MKTGVNAVKARSPVNSPETREQHIVWLLCLLAAIHVFVFSAAFPFFNNVDEKEHFDLVIKYSQGHIPSGLEPFSPATAKYVAICGSPEYLNLHYRVDLPGEQFPPPAWKEPLTEQNRQRLLAKEAIWRGQTNQESTQSPLYYALAGLWWRLGQGLGFNAGNLLYWLHFQNVLVMVGLVWLGFVTARMVFPGDRFLQLGVPALLAFFPQTTFYSVQNDTLSPLCFGGAFICLLKFQRAAVPDVRLGMLTGLTLTATFLAKISNLPLLAMSAVVVLCKIWNLVKTGRWRASGPALVALAFCAGLPMLAWVSWCKYTLGDYSGTTAKIQMLGWTQKPFWEWWHHPLLTPHGLWVFVSLTLASFWRGEFMWHCQRMALPAVDTVYIIASMVFVGVATVALLPRFTAAPRLQRQALWLGLASFAAGMAFLGFLSVNYDFHDCLYPSRAFPYFTSGRLILGALIPFLLLFVYGLERALGWIKPVWPRWLVLGGFILFMLVSEIAIDWPAFFSPYNWFHM